jgi:hypothetical protein
MADKIKILATVELDPQRVSDMLCAAFEGGSNYWCDRIEVVADEYPDGASYGHEVPMAGGELRIFTGDEDQEYVKHTITRERCIETLTLMAQVAPRHFADMLNENDDADTGDVFLQLCALGEIVFG